MPRGGLAQVVAVGCHEVYLTQDLNASFFRQRYSRHTNFAVESIDLGWLTDAAVEGRVLDSTDTAEGGGDAAAAAPVEGGGDAAAPVEAPGFGRRSTCTVGHMGDLVTDLVVEVVLRRKGGASFYPAEHLLKSVELRVGGKRIDFITHTWLRLYDELHRTPGQQRAHRQMTDFLEDEPDGTVRRFYVPLPFWFCGAGRSAALPLVAMTRAEVQLRFEFADAVPGVDPSFEPEVTVWADYVFLDTQERWRILEQTHRLFIEQTQMFTHPIAVGPTPKEYDVALPFCNPVSSLTWVLTPGDGSHGVFSARPGDPRHRHREVCAPLDECDLRINGGDRFKPRRGSFFRLAHPAATYGTVPSAGVYTYSFALFPTRPGPTGCLQFSRTLSTGLRVRTKGATIESVEDAAGEGETLVGAAALTRLEVFARSHNVLVVCQGLAGLEIPE